MEPTLCDTTMRVAFPISLSSAARRSRSVLESSAEKVSSNR